MDDSVVPADPCESGGRAGKPIITGPSVIMGSRDGVPATLASRGAPRGDDRGEKRGLISAALAYAAAVERNDLAALRSFGSVFGKFLGDAEQPLAAFHLGPDVLGMNAGGDP